jgi:hypothetical protein
MERINKALITARLGRDPGAWDFRGQCFDVGAGHTITCALTEQPTRFGFTLKPKAGKGRVVIGPAAFPILRRYAPDLFIKLERGRQFLQVFVDAEHQDMIEAALIKRVTTSEKKFVSLKMEARKRLKAYRMTIRRGDLPEYMAALRFLLERPEPKFETAEAKALWCDQSTTDFQQQLLHSKPDGTPVDGHPPVVTSLPEPTIAPPVEPKRRVRRQKAAMPSLFEPIPEIQF